MHTRTIYMPACMYIHVRNCKVLASRYRHQRVAKHTAKFLPKICFTKCAQCDSNS
jgi:hypothetical protein